MAIISAATFASKAISRAFLIFFSFFFFDSERQLNKALIRLNER
jgi:hypothetical protein